MLDSVSHLNATTNSKLSRAAADQTHSNNEQKEQVSVGDRVAYIEGLATELRAVAAGGNLKFLTYLLDLVIEETKIHCSRRR